jgi:Tfp pilus assembly PilM family ATPase
LLRPTLKDVTAKNKTNANKIVTKGAKKNAIAKTIPMRMKPLS